MFFILLSLFKTANKFLKSEENSETHLGDYLFDNRENLVRFLSCVVDLYFFLIEIIMST